MEDESASEKIGAFLKGNLLVVILATLGVICLGVGLITFFSQPSEEIQFESGENVSQDVEAAEDTQKTIFIDVAGAVVKPGLYELPATARIHDAIIAAGGFAQDADRNQISKSINLAQRVGDGTKIYIPTEGEVTESGLDTASTQPGSGSVNINSASVEQLDKLPGIGAVRAQNIIENRPYEKLEDLVTKKVLGQKTFDDIKEQISLY